MRQITRRVKLFATTLVLSIPALLAQVNISKGVTALTNVESQLTQYVDPLIKVAYVVAMIMGIAGGIRVYKKMQAGDQDAAKSGGALIGAAIFLLVILYLFEQFFLN